MAHPAFDHHVDGARCGGCDAGWGDGRYADAFKVVCTA